MHKQSLVIFVLAAAGGFLFSLLHLPLPWTLGPLAMAIIWKTLLGKVAYWPKKRRNMGLIVLGYMMGSPFTLSVAQQIAQQLPIMLLTTVILIALCLGTGYLAERYTSIGLANSLIGSIPGGLSQMSVICEETKGTSVSVVTLMQTVRVVTVVFTVPLLALHGIATHVTPAAMSTVSHMDLSQLPILAIFLATILAFVKLAKRLHISNIYVICPVLGTALLTLSGLHAPVLPAPVISLAQIFVGIRMGLDVDFGSLANWKKISVINLFTVLMVILLLLGVSYIFSLIYPVSFVTAFISMAPGGMSEMALTAISANADFPTVVAYQLFRLLFILLVCVPVTKWLIQKKLYRI
ncbi:AbrB family transcriptional regulator [Sporomusa acidovorans]|uniref:Ammonia monooxygenase n=1 Tax=Sporomusa acidovorans (strain ATCC 49682 / DSM 3132 / Mol) TaxID=1123286 RepID=A0ABZ3J0N4_SPOA4|nr:AbrB family transcriptional regulator [Sporomusa acidovorans]OZC22841.1 putative ammonia monooxygenase [Sporomusa acidovorans DSM 3132]SDE52705.1 hypothetical protein SAMN04488499_101588 [Sporomusa acidovorans]